MVVHPMCIGKNLRNFDFARFCAVKTTLQAILAFCCDL